VFTNIGSWKADRRIEQTAAAGRNEYNCGRKSVTTMATSSRSSGFVELRQGDRRGVSRLPTTTITTTNIRLSSMHSSDDSFVFEDTHRNDDSFGDNLDRSQRRKNSLQEDKKTNFTDTNKTANGSVSREKRQPRTGHRRDNASSKKDGAAWFTLSSSTISELSSVKSTKTMPMTVPMTMPTSMSKKGTVVSRPLEKEATLETITESQQALDDKNKSSSVCLENKEKWDDRSIWHKLSNTEIEAREREAALIRKLQNFHSSSNSSRHDDDDNNNNNNININNNINNNNNNQADGFKAPIPIHKQYFGDEIEIGKEGRRETPKPTTGKANLTRKEAEARRMVETLERKLQSYMGYRDSSNATNSSSNTQHSVSKASAAFQEDESIGANETTNWKESSSTEILAPSGRDDYSESREQQHSETNDRATTKEHQRHETQEEVDVGAYSLTEDSPFDSSKKQNNIKNPLGIHHQEFQPRYSDRNYNRNNEYPNNNNARPRQQIRDNEVIRNGGHSIRENPNERNENQAASKVQESSSSLLSSLSSSSSSFVVNKALHRYKIAVAAGTPETESLFLRCLKEVKQEQGDSNRRTTEHRQNKVFPKEIAFCMEDNDNNKKKLTKASSRIENNPQGSNELSYHGDEQIEKHSEEFSDDRDIAELNNSFPDAAPIASSDRKRNSIENRRVGPGTRRSGDETRPSKKSSDFPPATRRTGKKQKVRFPSSFLDLESDGTDGDENEDSVQTSFGIDESAIIQRSENLAEAAKTEGRMAKRTMIAISIVLCVSFLIILFVVLDPLRRLTRK
jgi:hypothetical protein